MRYLPLLFLMACWKSTPTVTTIKQSGIPRYCIRAQATYREANKPRLEDVELCTKTLWGCNKARNMAVKFGSFANLIKVDTCQLKI